mmetsp:Transcript_1670/g.5933  ORF Transcript_1670/g.5933 Transcript_1670/m.5933 type:complete len:539 (-) Transcript_1670:68-1684(-)
METVVYNTVRKWESVNLFHGEQVDRKAVNGEDSRHWVAKDLAIYTLQNIFPPTSLLVNRFADYPLLHSTRPAVILKNTLVLLLLMSNLFVSGTALSGFERYGPLLLYVFRAVSLSYMEAVNKHSRSLGQLSLYPVVTVDGQHTTAASWLAMIQSQSKYNSSINWRAKHGMHWSILSVLLSAPLALLPLYQRAMHAKPSSSTSWPALGEETFEPPAIIVTALVIFIISANLLRGFFQSFSFYGSMTSAMQRLHRSTVGSQYDAAKAREMRAIETIQSSSEKLAEAPADEEAASSSSGSEGDSDEQPASPKGEQGVAIGEVTAKTPEKGGRRKKMKKFVVDVTVPDNLRAWIQVHAALHARQYSLDATQISIAASGTLVVVALAALLFLYSPFMIKTVTVMADNGQELNQEVARTLSAPSLTAVFYVVAVLGTSVVFVTWVGDSYNKSAKNLHTTHFYEIELHAALDRRCRLARKQILDTQGQQRLEDLEHTAELLPTLRAHLHEHVHDIGLFGCSYSSLFYAISTMVGTLVSKSLLEAI